MSKATIVIPNINCKGWLKDSIESVSAHAVQNFRLIVVDNGSTDECLEQARTPPRVRFLFARSCAILFR